MLIADIILVIHFAFIAFLIVGQALMMIGYSRNWRWATSRALRGVHIACTLYVVFQTWAGQWCPLTLLENRFRQSAGQRAYGSSFIQDWMGRLIYYDLPPWVFTVTYTAFGALVIIYWLLLERKRVHKECT